MCALLFAQASSSPLNVLLGVSSTDFLRPVADIQVVCMYLHLFWARVVLEGKHPFVLLVIAAA